MLQNVNEQIKIHQLHCMAHVLLGFHSYLSPELKQPESILIESQGPFGKHALPVFKYGDHHGVDDRWEAYCSANVIKSYVGNYRDNRFNAIFHTSAEIFFDRQDFLTVLDSVKKPNLKLQAVIKHISYKLQ